MGCTKMNRTYYLDNTGVDDEDLEVESIMKNIKEPYIENNNNNENDTDNNDEDDDDDVIIVPTTPPLRTITTTLNTTTDKQINDEKLNLFKSISSKTLDVLCDLDESNINDIKSDLHLIKNIRDYQRPTRTNMKTIDNTVSMIKYKLKRNNNNNNRIRKKYRSEKLKEKTQCGRIVKSKLNRFLKYPLMISGVIGTVAASTYFTGLSYPTTVATAALSFNSITSLLTQFDWGSLLL